MLAEKKRTRKSVTRPRSGRRITRAQYDALAEAYFEEQNVTTAAQKAGLSAKTATKYINEGDAVFPAIRDRFKKSNETALAAQDADYVEKKRFTLIKVDSMLEQLGEVLEILNLRPVGEKTDDGKIEISVDEFRKIVTAFDELTALRAKLAGESTEQPGVAGPQITQVNILDKESVAAAAKNFLNSELGAQVGQPNRENGLRSGLAKASSARVADQEPIDVTPHDDDE